MPVISMFYGLIVSMYYLDTRKLRLPHIHVKYGEKEAVYQIPDGNLLEGSLPANKEKLLWAWIEIHKEDLMANWDLAVSGNKVFTIEPLK
ncbi:MAG: DUF4160 domain-containing protein [Bacteroidetes bacterium]|nr:DUF4160 domain-containing protein [Bacteroidota bacterium]MBS1632013.1 DUF4160 domain-containing protein [Bacteroidota bacterium]